MQGPLDPNFGDLDPQIMCEYLFFFLDIDDICKSMYLVNKKWHEAYKRHLNVRIFLLSEEVKQYEMNNCDIVENIRSKRLKYYEDYELDPPSKELAV